MTQIKRGTRSVCGFTLVELLAAVAIVGVLATLALPRYRAFIARSRSAEAKVNLATILSLERSYFYEYDAHAPAASYGPCGTSNCGTTNLKNELGFRTDDCTSLRYVYLGLGAGVFGANANSIGCEVYPGCGTTKEDIWDIYANGKLNHTKKVVEACKD